MKTFQIHVNAMQPQPYTPTAFEYDQPKHTDSSLVELNAEIRGVLGSLADSLEPSDSAGVVSNTEDFKDERRRRSNDQPAQHASMSTQDALRHIRAHDHGRTNILTHIDSSGKASMVDVGKKSPTVRSATAAARVLLGPEAFRLVAENQIAKGDVLTVSQLAGIMGAKHTSMLIPLCHPLLLSHVDVSLELRPEANAIDIVTTTSTTAPTGVEMEALTAAAISALTVYDMCKAAGKGIEITGLRLERKTGGKSGDWQRPK